MENYEKQAELSKREVQAQRRSRIVAVTVSAAVPLSAQVVSGAHSSGLPALVAEPVLPAVAAPPSTICRTSSRESQALALEYPMAEDSRSPSEHTLR